ncbi:MAG TPA: SpoIIE family protein phosphatase [Candidatus Cloacimonadota bacterium]|nr:SpoIIE family protein phosphatase [Candidatus Cloacimonadota bacterium]
MRNSRIKRPIVGKLLLYIGIPLLIVYSVILILNYFWSKDNALQQMKDYLVELTAHHASDLNADFAKIAEIPQLLAEFYVSVDQPSRPELEKILTNLIEVNSYISGLTLAFEPYSYERNTRLVAPYVYKKDGQIIVSDMAANGDYTCADWYSIPALLRKPYWSEPYYQQSSEPILMCSYSVPICQNGNMIGIATANISLQDIKRRMVDINIMNGYTFLISRYGTYIYHPNEKDVMKETVFSKAVKYNLPVMRELGRDMVLGKRAVKAFPDPITGYRQMIVYTPIRANGWTLSAVMPERAILSTVYALIVKQLGLMVVGLFVIILIMIWAAYSITNPLRKLVKMTEKLATGDLNVQMENIKGRDEIHELAMVFNKMVIDLKHYINDLTAATKEKEAVESELRIARHIQESLIPRIFPPFPHRKEFALFARCIPAKEVAGDFYDFFFLDEDNLVVVIADVSGKGVSASLFMAVTKTLIKAKSNEFSQPHKILENVNIELCRDNDSAMFVTTFLAVFNAKTGAFTYCNAGHNPPYLLRPDGKISQLENTAGMALGVWEDCQYSCREIKLQKNEIIYLYTDGVNEAMSEENEEFSYARMEAFLSEIREETPRQITEKSLQTVKEYTGAAEQSDDITILVLKNLL